MPLLNNCALISSASQADDVTSRKACPGLLYMPQSFDSSPTPTNLFRSLSREHQTASSSSCYGEHLQRDPCLKHIFKTTTCWPMTAYAILLDDDDDDVVSLTSSDPAASALLGSTQEEQEMSEKAEAEPSQSSCPAYNKLLKVMEVMAKKVAPWGRLNERFLSDHNPPAQVSLPFLPDLHTEIEKVTSYLNGKAYTAASQAYQADLLKDLDKGQGLFPDEVPDVRHTIDLTLRATKQAA
ncbi:L-2,4-diaminobutyric acid acetyltransferase [Labeo rohita]|uniref:L-2,4-diaminobutyric acid acetyltransferase n=1 Tax=Labeo rohita TaxID=84645 RepID=A0ABQ8MHI6_LABRO|nr:L-2,4-diaminobutyric acid acetyltransferase [Labeo rohita]